MPASRQSGERQRRRAPGRSAALPVALAWLASVLGILPAARAQVPSAEPRTVRIGVFVLFHPHVLDFHADRLLTLLLDGAAHDLPSYGHATLTSTADGRVDLALDSDPAQHWQGRALTVGAGAFTLSVPGKISRVFDGALEVRSQGGALVPVAVMETEVAVASIVAAESPPNAPPEALRAQAVVSRSYLLAAHRAHRDLAAFSLDACDTTHCQFLRSPPPRLSAAARATEATRTMVLVWRSSAERTPSIVAAMYSRSCGAVTRVPGGARDSDAYPFYRVRCSYCLRHPERWRRPAGTPAPRDETERLAWNRIHGWESIPSGNYVDTAAGLMGRGTGHGVGLCQLGAADLASRGLQAEAILAHFFPNTSLVTLR